MTRGPVLLRYFWGEAVFKLELEGQVEVHKIYQEIKC